MNRGIDRGAIERSKRQRGDKRVVHDVQGQRLTDRHTCTENIEGDREKEAEINRQANDRKTETAAASRR